MSATSLDTFEKTLQTTDRWLDDIMADLGPDRQRAWHVLSAVLRTVRDRVPLGLAAHLGAQLPLLVRGTYYDRWRPSEQPKDWDDEEEFLSLVGEELRDLRPVNTREAAQSVFKVLNHYVDPGQVQKVREALPEGGRALWPESNA